jgi:hypothetical protein
VLGDLHQTHSIEAGSIDGRWEQRETADVEMVQVLVKHGAGPTLADDRGRRPGDLAEGEDAAEVGDLLRREAE